MYYRKGRFSFYAGRGVFWLRIRNGEMEPKGFFFQIGREAH